VCGGQPHEVGPISGSGLCAEHALERFTDNLVQLVEHDGPRFEHWRKQLAKSVGFGLADEESATA